MPGPVVGRGPSTLIVKVCSDVILGEIMSSTVTPERTDVSTNKINVGLLPAYLTPIVAARLGVPAPGRVTEGHPRRPDCLTENPSGTCTCGDHTPDYSDGYGGTYAVGE
jgi:hypothetical protein